MGQVPQCGNALWAGLTASRYLLAATGADALLRTSSCYHRHPWDETTESAWSPSEKKEHYEHLMQGNLFNCYECLLRKKCLWPKITHTKSEKLSELRIFFTNRLLDWRRAFHGEHPLWYSLTVTPNRSDASFPCIPLMLELKKICNNLFMTC